jgi:hypothetical protein
MPNDNTGMPYQYSRRTLRAYCDGMFGSYWAQHCTNVVMGVPGDLRKPVGERELDTVDKEREVNADG